jgi:predicted dehydrogenase
VGAGVVAADSHLPAVVALSERITLVGVCDPSRDKAARLVQGTDAGCFTDLGTALRDTAPDLVLLATPPATHAELVQLCLRAGAWVICEKPAARSLAELDVIAAGEQETGNWCSFIYQRRFGSTAQLLRRLTDAGRIGPVRAATAQTLWFRNDDYYRVPWRGDWDGEGGGALSSLGVHALDLALWLSGGWVEVTAMAERLDRDIAVDNLSGAVVRLESGGLLTVVTSALSPGQETRLRLDYTDATVELVHLYTYGNDDWQLTVLPGAGSDAGGLLQEEWATREPDPPSQYAALFAAVLDARERGEQPPCSGADGRAAFELVTACYASALTGRVVRRGEIGSGHPFYGRLDGLLRPWSEGTR